MINNNAVILEKFEPHQYHHGDSNIQVLSPVILAFHPDNRHNGNYRELGIGLVDSFSSITDCWNSYRNNTMAQIRHSIRLLSYCDSIYDDTICACFTMPVVQ